MKKYFVRIAGIILAFVLCVIAYIIFDNSRVVCRNYTCTSDKIPKSFDGYKIALVTDFHNASNYEKIADAVRSSAPDIICICGDLVDMNTTDFTNTINFLRELTAITDTYYCYGNHEMWSIAGSGQNAPPVRDAIKDINVIDMNNNIIEIKKGKDAISITGFQDMVYTDLDRVFESKANEALKRLNGLKDNNKFSILMFHRAQYFDMISKYNYDLVLSGHLHGGHVNIPIIREKIMQMHFGNDKYLKGKYTRDGKDMIVCAGTALKDDLPRIFNTPEVVSVELKAE